MKFVRICSSQLIIKALSDQHHAQFNLYPILDDCKLLFSSIHSYDLVHVRHLANQAAKYLAKFAFLNLN